MLKRPRKPGRRVVPLDRGLGPSRCRECAERIVWALTDNDKRMPIDAQTVLADGAWVLWFDDDGDGEQRVSSIQAWQARTGRAYVGPLWASHWQTCRERAHTAPSQTGQLAIWAVINGGRSR